MERKRGRPGYQKRRIVHFTGRQLLKMNIVIVKSVEYLIKEVEFMFLSVYSIKYMVGTYFGCVEWDFSL